MRAIVTGGRDFDDIGTVYGTLDRIGVTVLAEGGASGADRLAALWAHDRNVSHRVYPADWRKYGRAAGPIRNAEMLQDFNPDAAERLTWWIGRNAQASSSYSVMASDLMHDLDEYEPFFDAVRNAHQQME